MTRDELIQLLMKHRNNDVSLLLQSTYSETERFLEIPAHTKDIKNVRYDSTFDEIVIDVEVYGLEEKRDETEDPPFENEDTDRA